MSSLLRGTKLLMNHVLRRNIIPVSGRWHYRGNNFNVSTAFHRCLSTDDAYVRNEGVPVRKLSTLEKQLEVMDSNVRWRGRIDREDMEQAIAELTAQEAVSEQSGLMLLRCCGSLLPKESPEKRMSIFKKVWKTLEDKGVEFTTSHYNARLRVQLENRLEFEAADIISEMESLPNGKPNRVTYQLLISRYCENGDIEGSKKILQHMKNEQLMIGEAVFNSLIRGHLKLGDASGFEEIVATMKSSGLSPGADTYKLMMRSHAEKGDIQAITKVIEEAENDQFNIKASHVLPAVIDLVENGHDDKLEEILSLAHYPRSHDVLNTMHQLVALGHDKAALEVYNLLAPGEVVKESSEAGSRSLLRSMVMHGRTLDELKSTYQALVDSGRLDDDITIIGLFALNYGQPALALQVFGEMQNRGNPVRPHYYWPIFNFGFKRRQEEDVFEAVTSMAELASGHPDYLQTLFVQVYKPLLRAGNDPTTVATKFHECGVKTNVLNSIQLLQLVRTGQYEEAVTFAQSSPFVFESEPMANALYQGLAQNDDWRKVTELLAHIQGAVKADKLGSFIETACVILASRNNYTADDLTEMANTWVEKEISIMPLSLANIKQKLEKKGVAVEITEKLDQLKAIPRRRSPLSSADMGQMSVEQLEKELSQRLPKDRDVKSLQRSLLIRYASTGMVEKAESLHHELQYQGFIFGPDIIRQLGIMTARYKKDADAALKHIEELNTKHPDFHNMESLILRTAHLLVSSGKQEDALTLIKEHTRLHRDPSQIKEENVYIMRDLVGELLSVCQERTSPTYSEEITDVLFEGEYVKPGTFSVLQAVVGHYLQTGDHDGLMKVLEKYEREYSRIPMYSRVFKALIEKEDTENLQKVVDLVTTIQDEMAVLHQLALTLVECKKYKHAQNIFETPGLRASMPILSQGIERLIHARRGEDLQALVAITRDFFGCDREEMLFSLIRYHAFGEPDATKCLDVLQMFEEEAVQPRPRTLRYLAKVLQSAGHTVDFEVPIIPNDDPTPKTPLEEEAFKALKNGDIEALSKTVEQMTPDGSSISDEFLAETVKYLVRKQGRPAARVFMRMLGRTGNVGALQKVLETDLAPTDLNTARKQMFIAQIQRGEAENTLSEMEAFPAKCTDYVSFQSLNLIKENCPQLMDRVEDVVERYLGEDPEKIQAANCLFDYHINCGEQEKAQNLWKLSEKFRLKIKLKNSSDFLALQKNEEGLRWLLSLVKEVSLNKASLVYSNLIAVKNSQEDWQGALEVLEEARAEGLHYTNFWVPAMKQLEQLLLKHQQQVPWEAGSLDKTPQYSSPQEEGGNPRQQNE